MSDETVRWLSPIGLTVASLAALGLSASCHLVGGTDGLFIDEPGGGSSGTGGGTGGSSTSSTSSNSTTGTAGGGGDVDCDPVTPPEPATDCAYFECIEEAWQRITQPTATPCDDNGGLYCDGAGDCVQCTIDDHCVGDSPCQDYHCVAAGCSDGISNGGETGVDCGGPCGACGNGQVCASDSDCLSWFCHNLLCASCGTHADCPDNSWYCAQPGDGGCHLKKANYVGCGQAFECESGHCCWLGNYVCTDNELLICN